MKNHELFSQIIDSYHDGQKGQAKEQIKRYGKNAFHCDLLDHSILTDYMKVEISKSLLLNRGK